MNHLTRLLGLGILGLAILVSAGGTQEKKGDTKEEKKTKTPNLPTGFKDLGLTPEQTASVRKIISEYKVKIDDLKKQIKELESKEKIDYFKVLTDDQRKKYLESKGVETGKEKKEVKDVKDAKKEDKK